jgi:hypothetical protein
VFREGHHARATTTLAKERPSPPHITIKGAAVEDTNMYSMRNNLRDALDEVHDRASHAADKTAGDRAWKRYFGNSRILFRNK